jgi:hypothetical protein
MANERSLDDLKSALRAWSDEARMIVSAQPNDYIVTNFSEKWMFAAEEYYLRVRAQEHAWMPGEGSLGMIPSYAALREAAEASSLVGPMLNDNIGTAVGLSSFNFDRFALAILPPPSEFMAHGDARSSFESRYDRLTRALVPGDAEYLVTYFLQGVSFDQDRIELEPDLVLERLTRQEIGQAFDDGIFKPLYGSVPVHPPAECTSFALKKTWRLPRITGAGISQRQRDEVTELINPGQIAEELLQCLALLSGSAVYLAGTSMRRIDDDFSMFASSRMFRSVPVPVPVPIAFGDGFRLNEAHMTELKRLWTLIHNESFPTNKALALAVRRLGFAAQRERAEDRLIDVLIAAEAFYLTDSGGAEERGELKYRLALRAAVWSEGSLEGWTRRQVFAHMRRAYDLRSVVAHGGEPKSKDVKIKDVQVSLLEVVEATEAILRNALKKALDQLTGSARHLSIPWDDLVLPEEGHLTELDELRRVRPDSGSVVHGTSTCSGRGLPSASAAPWQGGPAAAAPGAGRRGAEHRSRAPREPGQPRVASRTTRLPARAAGPRRARSRACCPPDLGTADDQHEEFVRADQCNCWPPGHPATTAPVRTWPRPCVTLAAKVAQYPSRGANASAGTCVLRRTESLITIELA